MNIPSISEFDGWKASIVGQWYFEHYLQGYANATAEENGRAVGKRGASFEDDYMILARQAGIVEGVEFAITADPFEEERKEKNDEDSSHRA